MKLYLSVFLDVAFSAFIAFILSFVLLNYFIVKPYSIVMSISFAIPLAMLSYKKIRKKNTLLSLSKTEQKQIEEMVSQLNLCSTEEQYSFFIKAFKKAEYELERKKDGILFKEKNVLIFCRFGFEMPNKTDVVKAFNVGLGQNKIYFLSDDLSLEIKQFINRFGGKIIAVDKKEIFLFLKKIQHLPKPKYNFNEESSLRVGKKLDFFKRKKAKSYFFFGLIFLIMSYFVPIKIYYLACGCVFLGFAMICKLFGN